MGRKEILKQIFFTLFLCIWGYLFLMCSLLIVNAVKINSIYFPIAIILEKLQITFVFYSTYTVRLVFTSQQLLKIELLQYIFRTCV